MQLEVAKLLADVLEAANSIGEFVAAKSQSDFLGDKLLRAGVYYQFAIIGEALSQLRALDAKSIERISEHARIIGFRNQIIHGYKKIDDEITWRIIETKLPILKRELEGLLSE